MKEVEILTAQTSGFFGTQLIMIFGFILLLYFLLIRPQNKRLKAHQELVNNLGVTIEKVNTNEMSDFPSFDRELKDKERSRMKKGVMAIYKTFLARVQASRGMSENDVQKLAQGRVWSGNEARENGLVDSIGGLSDAISIAVERANLEKYCVIHLPENLSPIEAVVKQFSKRQSICLPEPFTQYNYMLQNPSFFKALSKPQMRLPFVLEIN